MSCPDWRRLDPAARDASGAPHAAAGAADAIDAVHAVHWQQALSHLESGCPHCWREALAVDPTLIFRRLPAPELTAAQEAQEVEAARVAVAAMRTASRLDARSDARRDSHDARRNARGLPGGHRSGLLRRWQDWQDGSAVRSLPSLHVHPARWALAAGLTAMALVYGSGHGWRPPTSTTAPTVPAPATAAGAALASGRSPAGSERSEGSEGYAAAGASVVQPAASRPSIEGLGRPEARVYQLDSPHMSVVMIVDGKLDV